MDTPAPAGAFDRGKALGRLAAEELDVLVIGGGITGSGVALDAATRGLRTGLVERDDFASGTSSKSSKLVHGGLRYLQQREIGLVYENLAERQRRAAQRAPPRAGRCRSSFPIFTKDGLINRRLARALGSAMWMYDLTGGLRIGKRHKRIAIDEALGHMPTLRPERVAGAYLYYDAHTDDARLTLAVGADRRRARRRGRELRERHVAPQGRRRPRERRARCRPTATRSRCGRARS